LIARVPETSNTGPRKEQAMQQKTQMSSWDLCSCGAVRRASRQLGQLYDDVLEPSGLRTTQFSLMTQIHIGDRPSMKTLADALVMDLSALGHTLKPLVRDGLVELVSDPQDRRVKRVRLTAIGKSRHEAALELWRQAQARFDRAFGADRSVALRQAMAILSSPDFVRAFKGGEKG
jgi:DNA-binding MarR family transcriptional regulator